MNEDSDQFLGVEIDGDKFTLTSFDYEFEEFCELLQKNNLHCGRYNDGQGASIQINIKDFFTEVLANFEGHNRTIYFKEGVTLYIDRLEGFLLLVWPREKKLVIPAGMIETSRTQTQQEITLLKASNTEEKYSLKFQVILNRIPPNDY